MKITKVNLAFLWLKIVHVRIPKKILCNLVFLSTVILISACQKDIVKAPRKIDVLFTTSGLGDLSFNDNLYKGILEAYDEFGFEVEYAFPANLNDAQNIINTWIDSTSDKEELIFVLGFEYQELVNSLQGNFNNKKLVLVDTRANDYPNLQTIEFSFYGAAYQAGIAARLFCPNDTAGIIAGMDIPPIAKAVDGFKDGFASAQGQQTLVEYIDTNFTAFNNFDKAAEMASNMYQHTNLVFGVAGYANQGIFETLRKTDNAYAIGVDQDQSWLCADKIIGSVVKHIDIVAYNVISDFMDGKFQSGYHLSGLESGFMKFDINPEFEARLNVLVTNSFEDAQQAEIQYLNSTR